METVIGCKDHANFSVNHMNLNLSMDMLATIMDCFPPSNTVTYEAYNSPKWQKLSLSDSKFIAGNESDSFQFELLKIG